MSSSCIDISVSRIGYGVDVNSHRYGETINPYYTLIGNGMSFFAERVDSGVGVGAHRVGDGIKFRCGLACTVSQAAYLKVEPEVIWLLPNSAEIVVYSNVTWHIE